VVAEVRVVCGLGRVKDKVATEAVVMVVMKLAYLQHPVLQIQEEVVAELVGRRVVPAVRVS
jgi:hypothetical protein